MKINSKIKVIALSVSMLVSTGAYSALGGLKVHSNLGEPFSGTVTVSGNEAKELLQGGLPSVSDSRIQASVQKISDDKAVISLRSRSAVNDPVVVFQMKVGAQAREYTAIVDPAEYVAPVRSVGSGAESAATVGELKPINTATAQSKPAATARKSGKPAKATAAASDSKETKRKPAVVAKTKPAVTAPVHTAAAKPAEQAKQPEVAPQEKTAPKAEQENTPVVAASQPQTPEVVTASAVQTASPVVSETVSQVQAVSSASASIEQVASALQPAATQPVEEQSGGLSLPMKAGVAGIGLLALLLLARLFKSNKSAAPAPVVPPYEKREETVAEVHHDDIHVADEKIAEHTTPVVDTTPLGDDFKIDLDSLDQQQGGIPSSAVTHDQETLQRANVDWDEVESTESVYEDDAAATAKKADDELSMQQSEVVPVSSESIDGSVVYQSEDAATDTLSEEPAMEVDADAAEKAESTPAADSDRFVTYQAGDDWMKQAYASTEDKPVPEEQRFVDEPIFAETAHADSISHVIDDQFTQEREQHARELAERGMQSYAADDSILDFVRQGDQGASETGPKFEEGDFTWHTAAENAAAEAEVKPAEQTADMQSYAADDSVLDFVRQGDQGAAETGPKFEEGDFTWHTAAETTAVAPEAPPATQAQETQWEGGVATDDSELGLDSGSKPVAEGSVDWSSLDLDHQETAQASEGFVTESVGMTAPLEAKYELAEMYIEIGDMDAARETLRELLDESRGDIYDKSKALLAKLTN